MKLTKIFAAFSLFSILALGASAQSTQRTDRSKIKHGVKSGELTKRETKTLVHQQRDIRRDVKDAREDGVVTASERRHIKRDKKKADASIYRKKHNDRDRD